MFIIIKFSDGQKIHSSTGRSIFFQPNQVLQFFKFLIIYIFFNLIFFNFRPNITQS